MKKLIHLIIALLLSAIVFTTISCEKENFTGDSGTFIDSRDKHEYKWTKIENQIWMAENLNYEITEGSWSYYNETLNNIYGKLYNWETAKKVCPDGWHLPSKNEWEIFIDFVGGTDEVASNKLREMGSEHWGNQNGEATDEFGFTALPAGYFYYGDSFRRLGESSHWWTSTEVDNERSWRYGLFFTFIDEGSTPKNFGYSVRCIKDE